MLIDEVKDKVTLVDTGAIDKTEVNNQSDKFVYIKGGTLLKSKSQPRTIQHGVVIAPNKEKVKIPVLCIHASRGIRRGEKFEAKGLVPRSIKSGLIAGRSQSRVWSDVRGYYAMASESFGTNTLFANALAADSISSDDLVGVEEKVQEFNESLKKILASIPDYKHQVGVVIIDPNGVVGLELYDHPKSWEVFSKAIVKSYSDILTKEGKVELFVPNIEVANEVVKGFLSTLEKVTEEEVFNQNGARTVVVKADDYVGEYTTLNGNTIHLSVTRGD